MFMFPATSLAATPPTAVDSAAALDDAALLERCTARAGLRAGGVVRTELPRNEIPATVRDSQLRVVLRHAADDA